MDAHENELRSALEKLVEHADSVLIITTFNDNGKTSLRVRRSGNYYASVGAAQRWLKDEEAEDLGFQVAKQIKHEDE